MPTVSEIMAIWPAAQYLAVRDIKNKGLYGGGIDITVPMKIENIGSSVQRVYEKNPSDENVQRNADFLYGLCSRWALEAASIQGIAGEIASVSPSASIPLPLDFIVSSTSFIADGERTKNIAAFIGYNVEFTRGGVGQSTSNDSTGTYYSWDRTTGDFILYSSIDVNNGAAVTGERLRILPTR